MKLQSVSLVLVLGVVGLARIASGLCLMTNTIAAPKVYWYHCFTPNTYLTDIKSAPIDIPRIAFKNSNITVVQSRSFSRLSENLELIQMNFCETRDIEDDAFEGLVKLHTLDMADNQLQIVKGAWFKGLPKLETISFRDNQIKRIEESFFSIVPPLQTMDITANQINCLPVDSLATFKTKTLRFQHNPMSWRCLTSLMDWLDKIGAEYDNFDRLTWGPSSQLVRECEYRLRNSHGKLNDSNIKKCAEKMVHELLPPQENYTVEQVCQHLKDKPSPFLTC